MVEDLAFEKNKNYLQDSVLMSQKQFMKYEEIVFILIYHNEELHITYEVIGSVNKVTWEPHIKNLVWYTSVF